METASPVLPPFDYVRAEKPADVTRLLQEHGGEARLFMGGTDLLVRMRTGVTLPKVLIDVKHLPGMGAIRFDPQAGLQIGAAVNMNAIARHPEVRRSYPILMEAIETVASYQLRTRATMGGNLCNASPAADTAPAALVLGATMVAWGPDGERAIPITDFFTGPGQHALRPGEFLVRIELPLPPVRYTGRYLKLGRNTSGDLAIVGVAVVGYPDASAASGYRFRIALASVAPTPIRVLAAEALLAEEPITPETIALVAQAAHIAAHPIDDLRGSARYRKEMVRNLTGRALEAVWSTLTKESRS